MPENLASEIEFVTNGTDCRRDTVVIVRRVWVNLSDIWTIISGIIEDLNKLW